LTEDVLDNLATKIYGHLRPPITPEALDTAYSLGLIHKDDLEVGKTYLGYCRNAKEAVWTGSVFNYERTKFDHKFREDIECPEDDTGFDIFVAVAEQQNATIDAILDHLKSFFEKEPHKIKLWMTTENPMLGGVKPIDLVIAGRSEKLLKFIENVVDGNLA